MPKPIILALTFLALSAFSLPAIAADDATGTWKWTTTFGDKTRETTAKLKQDGEKLTGVYVGRDNTETPIEAGTVKDNAVSFKIVREFNGNKITIKYSGTLSGDTIKGKTEFEGGNQQGQPRDWEAKRQK
jgi:hypothetical protein